MIFFCQIILKNCFFEKLNISQNQPEGFYYNIQQSI
jgi:hypothetical protein